MKMLAVAAAAMALLLTPANALELGDPLGSSSPMRGVDGRSVTLADVKGERGTLVLFLCNHCPWVQRWSARIATLGNDYKARGIGVIAVNSNDPKRITQDGFEAMREMAHDRGYRFPYVVDEGSTLARRLGAQRTPEAFLFDANDELVYRGTIDDNADNPEKVKQRFLRDALEAVAEARVPARQESKAFGCTIKFYPSK
jgi:hypothetical protein